jgi:hypothetical protein
MELRRVVVVVALAAGLLGLAATPVSATGSADLGSAGPSSVAPVPAAGVQVVAQSDPGTYLWGLVLQGIANGVVDAGAGIMQAAVDAGPGALFWYQVGRSIFDLGCAWGYEGERLAPPPKPNFSFKCTLAPPWPY